MMHTVIVRNRRVAVVSGGAVADNYGTDVVDLRLDSAFDGCEAVLILGCGDSAVRQVWTGDPLPVPGSLMVEGDIPVSVAGFRDGVRIVTAAGASIRVERAGCYDGSDPAPDDPDMLQQLVQAAGDARSAADTATEAAGTATEAAKAAQDAVAKVDGAVSDLGDAAANAAAARESAETAAKSASDAKASESSARASAGSASSDAGSASSSATAARQSATEAASSATAAGQSATEAKASADSASESASSASADARTASQSASMASSAASSASEAAAGAQSAADAAQAAAASAQEAASTAQTAAETATTQAQAASSSASAAAQSAADAKASADLAAGWVPADGEPGQLLAKTDSGTAWVDPPSGNTLVGTATGYVAHADDAYAAKPREVRVKGRTVKNLWANPSGTNAGVTVTNNDDGSMTVDGVSTGDVFVYIGVYRIAPGSTYTLTIDKTLDFGSKYGIYIDEKVSDGSTIASHFVGVNSTALTFTTKAELTHCIFGIHVSSGQTVSGTYRVMLNEGSEAQPWCPPGLNGVDELSVVCAGKNLCSIPPIEDAFVWAYYSLVADETNKTIDTLNSLKGIPLTMTCTVTMRSADDVSKIPNSKTGIIVRTANCGDLTHRRRWGSGAAIGTTKTIVYKFTVPEDGAVTNFYIYGCGNSNDDPSWTNGNVDMTIQIEVGNESTEYEPPAVTTTPVDLDGHALNSLPNGTCDELVIAQDGTATVERRTQLSGGEVTALPEPTTETLDAVSLPKLPAPTFNVYHDSQVPSDTSVEYERDVNIAYAELEAKIAALTVAQATS